MPFLTIKNKKNKSIHALYNKRDDFPFEIVNYPNLSGNLLKQCLRVLIGQLLRISEACELYVDFVNRSKRLIEKLLKQSCNKH